MHPHDHDAGQGWARGPRGRKGRGFWFGPPWAGPPWAQPPGEPDEDEGPAGPGAEHWHGPHPGPGPNWFWGFGGPWRAWGGGWGRARRGNVRVAVLALLAERPMHGYEIIGELSERTEGLWRPSPGSIYPALALMEDEGLVTTEVAEPGGKRKYSLTDKGRAAAAAFPQAPWEQVAAGVTPSARALRHAVGRLMPAVGQVFTSGVPRFYDEAIKVLDDARRQLYAILAGSEAAEAHQPPDRGSEPPTT